MHNTRYCSFYKVKLSSVLKTINNFLLSNKNQYSTVNAAQMTYCETL